LTIKIDGTGRMRGGGTVRRSGRTEGGPAGAFAKEVVTEGQGPGAVSGPGGASGAAAMSAINGLLALQEVDDAGARASRGKRRGIQILDFLEDIRLGLLSGGIPRGKLVDLARIVQIQRERIDDPELSEILDEIDLRAQVELAKYTP